MPNMLPRQKGPAPLMTLNGRVITFSPRKSTLNKIALWTWLVLFVIVPLVLGIVAMIKDA